MIQQRWRVDGDQKLVAYLRGKVGLSGKAIRSVLEQNGCRINGKIERFGSSSVKRGDWIEFQAMGASVKEPLAFPILYEDEHLKIVDKPAGWVCDPAHCQKTFGPTTFLVHRLDKDTTGALLLAKGFAVRDALMDLFAKREVEKSYLALVDGTVKEKEGMKRSFLSKRGSFHGQSVWGSSSQGEMAVTRWKLLGSANHASLVLCQPLTGRTHQIRVHMAEMGHPLLIDRQYASLFRCSLLASRPLLHAAKLKFHFQGNEIEVDSSTPSDMKNAIEMLGMQYFL